MRGKLNLYLIVHIRRVQRVWDRRLQRLVLEMKRATASADSLTLFYRPSPTTDLQLKLLY